jgi:glucose-1-phosphate cytidylyltransferase
MKTILLAGGLGTRLAEETALVPKPMVQIGGKPILLHVMAIYGGQGFRDFVVACGYRAEVIKQYFTDIYMINSDFTVDLATGKFEVTDPSRFDWRVTCVDTGEKTMTGGRLKRLGRIVGKETFMVTYGDGVADVDINALVAFHKSHGKLATVTAVRPAGRFGALRLNGDAVEEFAEKVEGARSWINGGFFIFEPAVLDYIDGDSTSLEEEPLSKLAADGQLMAFKHEGYWHPVDTLRDRNTLSDLWISGKAPWRRPGWPF